MQYYWISVVICTLLVRKIFNTSRFNWASVGIFLCSLFFLDMIDLETLVVTTWGYFTGRYIEFIIKHSFNN